MSKINMFYSAKPHLFEKAKILRKNLTETESKLWEKLKITPKSPEGDFRLLLREIERFQDYVNLNFLQFFLSE